MPKVMKAIGADVFVAYRRWTEEYLPAISFVDLSQVAVDDRRVTDVHSRDADDVPTAALVVLLEPVLSISMDNHLVKPGLASRDWLPIALAARTATGSDALAISGMLGGLGAISVADSVLNDARARSILTVVGAVGIGFVAYSVRSGRLQEFLTNTRDRRADLLKAIGQFLVDMDAARILLKESRIGKTGSEGWLARIAQHLAAAPEPCTATEIVRALTLGGLASKAKVQQTLELLANSPSFVRVGKSRWQLGSVLAPRKCCGCLILEASRRLRTLS